jgi:succinate dehydrogenase / fumarate reductase flavoprotein subunit
MSDLWRQSILVCTVTGDDVDVRKQPLAPIPDDLLTLFDVSELQKYFTDAELTAVSTGAAQ